MKPTSIISLVVAVLLIIVGLVTCFIAQNMAQANGQFLFSEERDDDLVQTVDLTDSEISKIELIVENAKINIIGRAESSYIEFINFRENYYALSATNRVLSFDEIPDVMSMLKFWENGFSFKGMRYILNFNNQPDEDKEKVINIYLSSDKEIKIFDITADYCTIDIKNMLTASDYNIVTKEAVITADYIKTSSSFNINAGEDDSPAASVKLDMKTALINNININAVDLQMNSDPFRCLEIGNITCETGSINLATVRKAAAENMNITSESGEIVIEGEQKTSPYINNSSEDLSRLLKITSKSANISVSTAQSVQAEN